MFQTGRTRYDNAVDGLVLIRTDATAFYRHRFNCPIARSLFGFPENRENIHVPLPLKKWGRDKSSPGQETMGRRKPH